MTYCRFSSDDFTCDAYVYASTPGYVIHLAKSRVAFTAALPAAVPPDTDHAAAFARREMQVIEMVRSTPRVPIGLPYAGRSFRLPTARACADRLAALCALGYHIPARAIDVLLAESAKEAA
ncbi:MAG TPA: hypothetical protein VFQ88_07270 [Nevskiaceae bacterium]|nr:hypothetical protein [Nevskiaceae bacterium]